MIDDSPAVGPINRNAVISMVAAFFTLLSVCIAVAPIPLTGYVCYPSALVLALLALGTGIAGLGQIKAGKQNGRTYALIGIWVGGLSAAVSMCAITVGILLFPRVLGLINQYLR